MNYHVFTATVLDTVHQALLNEAVARTATVYCGTLFVVCNAYAAAKLKTALKDALQCGVRVSKVGPEYTFDFV